MPIKYIPVVTCAKCKDKLADHLQRRFEPGSGGGRRFIEVRCHGERAELPFADEAGQQMTAFAE